MQDLIREEFDICDCVQDLVCSPFGSKLVSAYAEEVTRQLLQNFHIWWTNWKQRPCQYFICMAQNFVSLALAFTRRTRRRMIKKQGW